MSYPTPVTEEEVEKYVAIAAMRYANFDGVSTKDWALHWLKQPDKMSLLCTENAVCGMAFSAMFWNPSLIYGNVIFICASKKASAFEAYKLLKAQMKVAFDRRCENFVLNSATACDLSPFARRLGLRSTGDNYVADFR